MKKKIVGLILIILLLTLPFSSCAQSAQSAKLISPAVNCLAEQSYMAVSAVSGNSLKFSASDFARAVNLSKIDSITITSLPPVTDGELRVGSTVLTAPQTLSAASVSLMTYHPSASIKTSQFKFKVNDSPYELCCKLYVLDKTNYAPTLATAPATALEVSTHKNVIYYGSLPCYDPDGDETFIEIVSYPEKGLLIIDDNTLGTYRYIPYENSTGEDSFCYIAGDKYGNYSASATVTLTVNEKQTPVNYVDLNDSRYHSAALTMTEQGIMSGTQVGSSTYFYPDRAVSRAEFVVMAMNAMGIRNLPASSTVFADDPDISSDMKKYIATAYDLGYIKGSESDGKLFFYPNREISRAEASVILASMLDAATPTVTPVFSDSDAIPTWARSSVYALASLGVLPSTDGSISASSTVTRGDAALILTNFMAVNN